MSEKPWYPDERPWKEHDGGPCPIAGDELCEVLLRYRRQAKTPPDVKAIEAQEWDWVWEKYYGAGDIVAYLTKADSDAWEAEQKANVATVDPELIDALNEFARLGQEPEPDPVRPLAVGDLVKHVAPGSPKMRVAWVRGPAKVGLDTVPPRLKAEWFTADGAYQYIEAAPAEFVRVPHE